MNLRVIFASRADEYGPKYHSPSGRIFWVLTRLKRGKGWDTLSLKEKKDLSSLRFTLYGGLCSLIRLFSRMSASFSVSVSMVLI